QDRKTPKPPAPEAKQNPDTGYYAAGSCSSPGSFSGTGAINQFTGECMPDIDPNKGFVSTEVRDEFYEKAQPGDTLNVGGGTVITKMPADYNDSIGNDQISTPAKYQKETGTLP